MRYFVQITNEKVVWNNTFNPYGHIICYLFIGTIDYLLSSGTITYLSFRHVLIGSMHGC